MVDPALQPLKLPEAKQLAREIMENGNVSFSGHAIDEMANDDLHTTDCLNLLRLESSTRPSSPTANGDTG